MTLYKPTRRALLSMAAAAPALTLPVAARAQATGAPASGNPGHFSFTVGEAKITVASDGHFSMPTTGLGVNADRAEVEAFLESYFMSPDTGYSHTNHLIVELGDAKVLVDVGSGTRWLDGTGKLLENLEAGGHDPSSITHVVITHAHPDHIWGIRDDFDEPILPDAEYFIGGAERDFWMDDGLVDRVEPAMQQFVVGAQNAITAEGVEWTLLANEQEIAPGIRVIDTPGHTPGHMSLIVESNGQQLIALGDSMSHAYTNFAHPEWYNEFDMDGDVTVATRKRLLDMAASDRMAVLGYHFPFPGVGHVRRVGDAYQFIPAMWQW